MAIGPGSASRDRVDAERDSLRRAPRAISGVPPENLLPNTTRHCEPRWPRGNVASRGEEAYAPKTRPRCQHPGISYENRVSQPKQLVPEITHRRSGELVRGVFKLLSPHPEGLPSKSILERLAEIVPPTEFEKTTYPRRPDVRRYEKIVRFSTIGPVKAGWLVKNKGLWILTDAGRKVDEQFSDPEQFMREASRLDRKWAAERPQGPEAPVDEGSPDAATTLEEAEEAAWTEIEEHLEQMNPYDFQELVAGLLRAMGYHVAWVSPPGPDKGIDVIAHTDPLGIQGPRIKVQVKRRSDKTTIDGLRSLLGLLGEGDVGLSRGHQ